MSTVSYKKLPLTSPDLLLTVSTFVKPTHPPPVVATPSVPYQRSRKYVQITLTYRDKQCQTNLLFTICRKKIIYICFKNKIQYINKTFSFRTKFFGHKRQENLFKLVADATLFDFILVFIQYIGLQVHKTNIFFCLGFALWMYLQDDWKLACRGAELS
jgi:hypothetical protein